MVADICFKGEPENGRIAIGYGTYTEFQGKGYMTEAVKLLCDYAFSSFPIIAVTAETDADNIASIKVLQKNGFISKRVGK